LQYPTFYLSYITRKTVILINVCLWIVASSTFGIPWSQNYHRMGHKVDHLNRTLCEPQFPPAMSFSFAALTFVVPSVAMLIIYRKLHTYSKQTTEKFQLLFKTLQLNYPDLDPKIPFQSEQRATTTIGLTMTAFIVCWAPFFVTVMSKALFKNACCPRWLTLVCFKYFDLIIFRVVNSRRLFQRNRCLLSGRIGLIFGDFSQKRRFLGCLKAL